MPFNDLEALRAAVGPRTAAVLLEPVQGEGGVVPADPGFIAGVRRLCDERGILLLFDEVQCGMGRTGHFFAYQRYGVEPDAMSLAKALANGMSLGAFEVRAGLEDVLPPGTHASTFGGNPLAMRRQFSSTASASNVSNTAMPAAQARGLPPKVLA